MGNTDPETELLGSDGLLDRFQQLFSLFQIRLVGAILIGYFVLRCALLVALAPVLDPFMRLSQLSALANSAILLPLGCALYLLGSGYRRLAAEKPLLRVMFPLLLPLSISIGLLLPLAIMASGHNLQQQQQTASRASQAMLDNHRQWERRMATVPSITAARAFTDAIGVPLPMAADDPMPLVRWRFAQALHQRHDTLLELQPLATITPYQQELLSMGHQLMAVVLSLFSGGSLLLLFLQGRSRFRRYHVSSSTFLTAEAVKPRHRNR
ncbi:MAG: hypothetical protein VKM68_08615 [Cyanobacteriota bacterium]|nr:hypothetical protein [Cyanobacteriota bacterium]